MHSQTLERGLPVADGRHAGGENLGISGPSHFKFMLFNSQLFA